MKRTFKISGLLAAMLLLSSQGWAAGLGRMSVQSSLGQPLRAEIELLSVQPDELAAIEASLAGTEAYRQAGIERSAVLGDLKFVVDKRANGQLVVRLSSSAPVNEPFMDVLIELSWNSGRILREYTVLLDPVRDPKPAAAPLPPAMPVTEPVRRPEPAVKPAARPASPEAVAKPDAKPDAREAVRNYGPVKSGETLRSIAEKVRPADVTLEMMVASLYQTNKQAFAQDNMNLLKRGQTLAVPDRDAVMRMYSPQQAKKLISEHVEAWQSLRGRVADSTAVKAADHAAAPAGKGRIEQARPSDRPQPPEAPKDVLKLSKGEPPKSDDANQRVRALEEETAAKARALKEAQERVDQLEQTVEDLRRLMAMKEAPGAAPASEAATTTEAKSPEPAEAAVTPPAVAAPAEEKPGLLATLLANPLYIAGALGAIALSGLLWVAMASRRRRQGLSGFEQSVMTGGDQFKTAIFKTETAPKTMRGATTQSGVATDFSRLGLGSIDTHEVDPIAEAEVYMAYGRDAQAEEILKEALSKDGSRHEIALKLLEIYATRQDVASFETQASELYAALADPGSDTWLQAAEMGRKLDPANPLYRVYGDLQTVPVPMPEPSAEPAVESMSEPMPVIEEAVIETVPAAEPVVDEFDLDGPVEVAGVAPISDQPEDSFQLDDIGFGDLAETESGVSEMTMPEPEAQSPGELDQVDIDLADFKIESTQEEPSYPAFGQMDELQLTDAKSDIPEAFDELDVLPEELDAVDLSAFDMSTGKGAPEPGPGDLDLALDEPDGLALDEAKSGELPAVAVPDLDFSGIDLELGAVGDSAAETLSAEAEIAAAVQDEFDPGLREEVNTKLDLARAYMEMGDNEGAREILEEVVKEGDVDQRRDAEGLIASL